MRFAFFFLNGDSGVKNFKHVCYGVCMVSGLLSLRTLFLLRFIIYGWAKFYFKF